MRRLVLVIHNVRSAHNVGSLLRTADGFGAERVYLTGYSPYPAASDDERPPHIRRKTSAAIAKTALGAEKSLDWRYSREIEDCLDELRRAGYQIAALEQTASAAPLPEFSSELDIALIVGNEVDGLDKATLAIADFHVQIPMMGAKESFNVAAAAAAALYHLRYVDKRAS